MMEAPRKADGTTSHPPVDADIGTALTKTTLRTELHEGPIGLRPSACAG